MVNLPAEFIAETRRIMGEERFNRFLGAFDEEAPCSLRVNVSRKVEGGRWNEDTHSAERVPWCTEGYYLQDRPQFTFDPLFHAGCYYVQEASSMFITHILRSAYGNLIPHSTFHIPHSTFHIPQEFHTPQTALDLCAAPGGKSTALRSVLPDDCVLVSNEPMGNRAQILLENITKWGAPNCIVTNNYPRDFRKAKLKFDMILCDVPCSGEGMFRKDPATISEWSPQNVEKCWQLQRDIVADAWECLNPGGLFIYSTCTFNTKENEENIRWILENFDAEVLDIPVDPSWNITGSLLEGFDAPVYRFIPGITRGEGLFACAMRKVSRNVALGSAASLVEECGMRNEDTLKKGIKSLKVLDTSNLIPHSSTSEAAEPSATFNIPHKVDLPYSEALKYLRGEALVLPPDTPKGIVEITYKGQKLGQAKNIGNRANNLYPKAWRIKTTHLPTEEVKIINI